jgi:hypothetical protein
MIIHLFEHLKLNIQKGVDLIDISLPAGFYKAGEEISSGSIWS